MSLFKLAFRNIKKSIKDYSIYFITLVIAISIFYLFNSLDSQTAMLALNESTKKMVQALVNVISSLSIFVAIVLGFLIVYANNFIIKRRKKEIGIYLMLGMSNVKVSMILVLETILVGIISLITGILIGIGLSQLVSVFVAKLFEADMTKFSFVFSSDALIWSVISFSLIYVIVTTFNLITLNRFKLIDLLSAKRKNEKVRIKNNWLILIIFIISLITIGYAYKLLYDRAILIVGNDFIKMIILGSLGTFLFFLSVSGFLLKVISLRKKLYYKDLNIFILKQVSNKINTHVVSTTVISLMLLLTIGILSASLSLANAMNESFSSNTPYDFSAATNEIKNIDELTNSKDYQSIVAKSFQYQSIIFDDLTYSDFISQNNDLYLNMDYLKQESIMAIKESDFNKLMELANKDNQKVELSDNQYILVSTLPMSLEYYNQFIKDNGTIQIANNTLNSKLDHVLELSITNSNGNQGFVVVSDNVAKKYGHVEGITYLVGNYENNKEVCEEKFNKMMETYRLDQSFIDIYTKIELKSAGIGSSAMFTFVGLYLGIVFAIASGTVLAIEQLSEAADNKERYRIINQLGASKPMVNRSLFIQIGIAFMFPLAVALIHSLVGLNEINHIISLTANIDIGDNILITALFIIVAYGGYYFATYLASNRIINE